MRAIGGSSVPPYPTAASQIHRQSFPWFAVSMNPYVVWTVMWFGSLGSTTSCCA
jgi:hypothetical protein